MVYLKAEGLLHPNVLTSGVTLELLNWRSLAPAHSTQHAHNNTLI